MTEAAGGASDVRLSIDIAPEEPCRVVVEPFSWVAVLSAVLDWLRAKSPAEPVEVSLSVEEEAVVFTFRIRGTSVPDLSGLGAERIAPLGEAGLSLDEILARNRAEMWTRRSGGGFEVRLGLIRSVAGRERVPGIADQQPEFYDFDLFLPHPTRESAELLATPLADLEYVVFDTETTGLNPSDGDEIVSLSAVRVRRGKMVAADTFHTLVNPCRHIPESSTRFHGIDDSMIGDAPTLDQVLPQFKSYLRDSVLVAHNAAFDKKFLDLAAAKYRMAPLENPLLDTLLLSYGLHRDFEGHNLDAIAQRLGVEIQGRHTSLGDAKATAEILLGLVSLLSARGIGSLADAKAFCDQMLLFRWQTSRY
ncbi:MAG: 3'-5' exonuclease [Deltaproteobacteria bacterium]|nr:3'-5' exonuclease [Deltaproteobacteria bacterium]